MVKRGGLFDPRFIDSRDDFLLFYIFAALLCCALSALAAGLTMCYVSLDPTKLRLIQRSGTDEEKRQVAEVLPLLRDHHRLLVTLLLSNTLSNESLPIFLDALVPSWLSLLLSVTAVFIFAEVLPQSFGSGSHKLWLASKAAPVMRLMLVVYSPIALPCARLLDRLMKSNTHKDDEDNSDFSKEELKAMLGILRDRGIISAQQQEEQEQDADAIPNPVLATADSQSCLVGMAMNEFKI